VKIYDINQRTTHLEVMCLIAPQRMHDFHSTHNELWVFRNTEEERDIITMSIEGTDIRSMAEAEFASRCAASEVPEGFTVLPPPPSMCHICAREHAEHEPHDALSLYWHTARKLAGAPPPTWQDALDHCPPAIQRAWEHELKEVYGYGCPECHGWKDTTEDYLCSQCRATR
jgi:hypothetical protein